MTGRERVCTAMDRAQADRVPFMCQLAIGHYLLHLELEPADLWLHSETFANALVTLAERYGLDGILVNLPGRDPEIDRRIARREPQPNGAETIWFEGYDYPLLVPAVDLPHHPGLPTVALDELDPDRMFYEDPHTLGGLKWPFSYDLGGVTAADERLFPSYVTDIIEAAVAASAGRFSVHSEVFSPFTQLMERLGYQDGLMALFDDPDKCRAILARLAEGAGTLGRIQAAHGVDAVLISSAFAGGGFISKAMYEEFVLPSEARVVELIQPTGVKVYTHTCGHISDRLELMAATGIDGIDTMDPPPLGNTELADAKQRVGDKLFLKGNLDSVNVLLNCTPDQVRTAARQAIADAGEGGGYILSSACSVAPGVPTENLLAMAEVARADGACDAP